MGIKPANSYRSKDGRKFYVATVRPDGLRVGWEEAIDPTQSMTRHWHPNGLATNGFDAKTDLVAMWVDRPAEESGWKVIDDIHEVVKYGWQYLCGGKWYHAGLLVGESVLSSQSPYSDFLWFRKPVVVTVVTYPRKWWQWRSEGQGWYSPKYTSQAEAELAFCDVECARLVCVTESIVKG